MKRRRRHLRPARHLQMWGGWQDQKGAAQTAGSIRLSPAPEQDEASS